MFCLSRYRSNSGEMWHSLAICPTEYNLLLSLDIDYYLLYVFYHNQILNSLNLSSFLEPLIKACKIINYANVLNVVEESIEIVENAQEICVN